MAILDSSYFLLEGVDFVSNIDREIATQLGCSVNWTFS